MKIPSGFWKTAILATVALCFVLFVLLLSCWRQLPAGQQEALLQMMQGNSGFLVLLLGILGVSWAGGLLAIFQLYVQPVNTLTDELLLILSVNPSHRLSIDAGRGLRRLSELINEGADRYQSLEKTVEDRVGYTQESLRQENNILTAIVASLAEGVVVCTTSATVIYVNNRAKEYLGYSNTIDAPADDPGNALQFIGPGRDVCSCLTTIPLRRILTDIHTRFSRCCSRQGYHITTIGPKGHFLTIDIAPLILPEQKLAGYVLKMNPVSSRLERRSPGSTRDDAIPLWCRQDESLEGCHPSCLLMRMQPTSLAALLERVEGGLAGCGVIFRYRGGEGESCLVAAVVDDLAEAITLLLQRISAFRRISRLNCQVRCEPEPLYCDFLWEGLALSAEELEEAVESRLPSDGRTEAQTVASLLQLHGVEVLWEKLITTPDYGGLRLVFPATGTARRDNVSPVLLLNEGSLFSDFDLYATSAYNGDLNQELLGNLTYTVFDLETTGLDPLTDEIISIGAVRWAHGQLLPDETFSLLVDPQRDVPEESRRIHGISLESLKGQPTIETALPMFHRFASDTVLVGHNVAFDMRMLQMKRYVSPLRFTQPVLDTMHLSAILHPYHRNHSLESTSRRLGVRITGRHTAVGDATAAAEILHKCLPLLARKNILTLGDARRASRQTRYGKMVY